MPKEIDPRKTGSLLVRIAAAGAISIFPSVATAPVSAHSEIWPMAENAVRGATNTPELSKDSQLSELLEENEMRMLIGAVFLTALASSYLTYRRSKKYDDDSLKGLKVSASLLTVCAAVSMGVDSFYTIDRHIPAALFAGGLLIQAGANLIDIYQRERDPDLRNSALATSIGLVGIGTALLYAVDRI